MNRRIFALSLGSLFTMGCSNKPKVEKDLSKIQVTSPKWLEFERIQLEIGKDLGDKLRERNWKLEDCSHNLFSGLPNLQFTKLHWHKCQKGYYFFIRKYQNTEKIIHTGTPKIWIIEGLDDETTVHSKIYNISDDEASQMYINLALAFMVK